MAQFDTIRRTGKATSEKRFLVGIIGHDTKTSKAERVTFSTPIIKVAGPDQFRQSGGRRPIEQYAFMVRKTTYERFAGAAAAVLRIHHASLKNPEAEDVQEYLKVATKINAGEIEAKILKEQPEDFIPAIVKAVEA